MDATATANPAPTERSRHAVLAWSALAVSLALLAGVGVLVIATGAGLRRLVEFPTPVAFGAVGVLVARRRPANAIGWLFVLLGLVVSVALAGQQFAAYSLDRGLRPAADWGAWLGTWPIELLLGMLTFVFLLFPEGRLPSRGWRAVAWVTGAATALPAVASAISNVNLSTNFPVARHPLDLAAPHTIGPVYSIGRMLGPALLAASVVGFGVRLRRSRGALRDQLKWVAYASAVSAAAIVATALTGLEPLLGFHLFVPAIAIAVGVAILTRRLYDIDLIVNRTMVYAVLTAGIAAAYLASAATVSALVQRNGRGVAALAIGALVAALFGPLRQRVQQAVDRLMYGLRDDPYEVVSRLGRRLEATVAADAVLPDLAQGVAQALRLPFVSVEVRSDTGFATAASYGRPVAEPVSFPLTHRGETVGRLLVARRSAAEELSATDRRLLEDLSRQAGMAVEALRLTADLQRSRERLVTAREEERRRLRRDLHDGLGPALAGMALQLDAAAELVGHNPPEATALMLRLKSEVQTAVADIRRLVYDLRPPALDELGLVGAVRQQALQFTSGRASDGLAIDVEAPAELRDLPAAVEVAAYRIVIEAINNVSRHACARRCTVRIALGHDLELDVIDEGNGLPAGSRPGVGLTSMRERAAELGGTCTIESLPGGGTHVAARLPVTTP